MQTKRLKRPRAESFCARISVPVILFLILCALLLRHRKSRCGEYLKLKDSLGRLPFLEGRPLPSFWTLTIDLCSCIPVKAESGILSKRKHNHLALGHHHLASQAITTRGIRCNGWDSEIHFHFQAIEHKQDTFGILNSIGMIQRSKKNTRNIDTAKGKAS